MNRILQQLLTQYKTQRDFADKLNAAQAAWTKFRDADVDSFFYSGDKLGTYGSVYPMCQSIYLRQLTDQRTRELRRMLNRDRNDVCGFVAVASRSAGDRNAAHCSVSPPNQDPHVSAKN